jgi:alkylation response protein AidB-like acyl-CoA dehydrogenase
MTAALVESAVGLCELIEANADAAEKRRRLSSRVVNGLREADLLRMCVPTIYGGPAADPLTMATVIETVSAADGATGWCVMIASTTSSVAHFLPPDGAREIFGDRSMLSVGVFAPNGTAQGRHAGYKVDGRWNWGSFTHHCQWVCGGVIDDADNHYVMFFPIADATIHDTWHTSGMRGTGSNEFSVHGAVVPSRRVMKVGDAPQIDEPLARFPNFTLLAAGVASVAIGIAVRAVSELVELANDKRPQFSQRTIAQHGSAQVELGRAVATIRSARAYLHEEIATAWDQVVGGGRVDVARRARIRLAGVYAAEAAAAAVDRSYTLAGGSAVYETNLLQRCLRDVHVATQHIMVSPRLYETLGKHAFGAEIDARML